MAPGMDLPNKPVERCVTDHGACLRLLREAGYGGWLSIKSAGSSPLGPDDALGRTLDKVRQLAASIDGES